MTFGAHVYPGVFMLIWGSWWSIASLWAYLTRRLGICSRDTGIYSDSELRQKSYFPNMFLKRVPLEPIIKIVFTSMGLFIEFCIVERFAGIEKLRFHFLSTDPINGTVHYPVDKLYHITMYSSFMSSGIMDLVSLWLIARLPSLQLPRHTTQLFLALAFVVEGSLWYSHSDDSWLLHYRMHVLLAVVVLLIAVFAALRMLQPNNILINASMAFLMMLQGTWLIQLDIVLNATDWDQLSMEHAMVMQASFYWHCGAICISMLVTYFTLGSVLKCYVARKRHYFTSTNKEGEEMEYLTKPVTEEA